jgi:hypothetical protein
MKRPENAECIFSGDKPESLGVNGELVPKIHLAVLESKRLRVGWALQIPRIRVHERGWVRLPLE